MKIVNQQLIKDSNLKLVYQYIHQHRGISRAELAKIAHLSKTTVSSLVDELIDRRFILDSGTSEAVYGVGRKPNSLAIRSGCYDVIVLRWARLQIDAHLTDISGVSSPILHMDLTPEDTFPRASRHCVDKIIAQYPSTKSILGVCIIVPAMIDPDREEIYSTTLHFNEQDTQTAISQLKELFPDYPVAILNDTACFAYAEKIYAHINQQDFAFINFDQGIGATLFIRNKMLGHASASYTQFGHYSIDPNGKTCICGNHGCLELMIGESSLQERLAALNSPLLQHSGSISYEDIGYAALHGDETARQVTSDIAWQFSQALANLICIVHPKLIIIGGKGRGLGAFFLRFINDNLSSTGFRRMTDSVEIRYSLLDQNSCFCGAMKYFFDIHYRFTANPSDSFFIG